MLAKRKRVTRKRPVRRTRKRVQRKKRTVPRGIPSSVIAKLSYSDATTGSVSAGSTTSYTYHSSLFDPYFTAGGHQPMCFDQYAILYNSYTVFGVGYRISVQALTGGNDNAVLAVYTNTDGSTITHMGTMLEQKRGVKTTFFGGNYTSRTLKGYVSVAKSYGVSLAKIKIDDQFSAVVTADPLKTTKIIFHIYNQSTNSVNYQYTIQLTYYCRFFDMKIQTPS